MRVLLPQPLPLGRCLPPSAIRLLLVNTVASARTPSGALMHPFQWCNGERSFSASAQPSCCVGGEARRLGTLLAPFFCPRDRNGVRFSIGAIRFLFVNACCCQTNLLKKSNSERARQMELLSRRAEKNTCKSFLFDSSFRYEISHQSFSLMYCSVMWPTGLLKKQTKQHKNK